MASINPAVPGGAVSAGPAWEAWQAGLPDLLTRCRSRWSLEGCEPLARRPDATLYRVRVRGREAVLKLALPGEELRHEARILEAARGEGYVHLYDGDEEAGALLLESLGPSLEARGEAMYGALPATVLLTLMHDTELAAPIVETLKVAWRLPRDLVSLPDEASFSASMLRTTIDARADSLGVRGHYADALARARLYAEHRESALEASALVVCHGDPRPANLAEVRSRRPGAPSGYVWVNPIGLLCEREYDLGVVLRGFNRLILAADDPVVTLRGWCAVLAESTDTDAEAIWQWAFIERVSCGLSLLDQGCPERGRRFLDSASWLIARKGA